MSRLNEYLNRDTDLDSEDVSDGKSESSTDSEGPYPLA